MANDFKNAIAQNISNAAGGTTIYTTPASKSSIMLELDIANTTQTVVEASVEILDASVSSSAWRYLVKNAPVPSGGSLMVIAGQKIVLEAGDAVRVTSSAANVMDTVAAILEDVNS
tara:strand:+ start:176 stop:523 length:348 start_codon:yes stop_codon:yes gene_type:complete